MPSISQMDYIVIDVPSTDYGDEESLSIEAKRQLFRCAENNTIGDVLLFANGLYVKISAWELDGDTLQLFFYSRENAEMAYWSIINPDIEES